MLMDLPADVDQVTFISENNDILFYTVEYRIGIDAVHQYESEFVRFKPYRGDKWENLRLSDWRNENGPDYVLTELMKRRGGGCESDEFDDYSSPVFKEELEQVLLESFAVFTGQGRYLPDRQKLDLVYRAMDRIFGDGVTLEYDEFRGRLHEGSTEVYDLLLGDCRINRKKTINLLSPDYGASKQIRPKEWWLEQEGGVSYSARGSVLGAFVIALLSSPLWGFPLIVILSVLINPSAESIVIILCMLPIMGVTWFIFLAGAAAGQLLRRVLTIDFDRGVVTLSEDLFGIGFYDVSESLKLSKVKCVRIYEAGQAAPGADRVKICTHEYFGGRGSLDATMLFERGKFDSRELAEMLGVKWKPRYPIKTGNPSHPEW